MGPAKIIARFRDGRMAKGLSHDFFPNKPHFHVNGTSNEPVMVKMNELKAVFFVRSFGGNPAYVERKGFLDGEKPPGRKVEVTFEDGEVVRGSILGYNPKQTGFFLFPVDPNSNNTKVFVVNGAVKGFQYL